MAAILEQQIVIATRQTSQLNHPILQLNHIKTIRDVRLAAQFEQRQLIAHWLVA